MGTGYSPDSLRPTLELGDHRTESQVRASTDTWKQPFELLHADDLDIRLLGDFRVRAGGRIIVESDWPLRRARNLLKLLALAPGHRIHREQLMDLLWPEQTQEAAANNLHKALHVARHVLEPSLLSKVPSRYIQLQGDLVLLRAPGEVRVDVESFRALAESAHASEEPEDYIRALSLYTGDLLPQDPYEDWAIPHRERLKHLRLEVLLRLARALEERNETEAAIRILQQIVDIDDAHEEAQGRLMLLLTRSGARQMALRQYHRLQTALKEELDADPAPSIQKLYQDLRENRLPLFQPDRVHPSSSRGELQRLAIPPHVIGREQEVHELSQCIHVVREGTGKLVILRGEAGSGKSYLIANMTDYAAQQGLMTLVGQVSDATSPLPYQYLSSALGDFVHRSTAPMPVTSEAANLAQLLNSVPGSHLAVQSGTDVDSPSQTTMVSLVQDFFRHLCTFTPTLFVLDNLPAADEASLHAIAALAKIVDGMPLLLVAVLRQTGTDEPSSDILQAPEKRNTVTLTLHPLAFSETATLVSQLLDAPVERRALEAIHSIANGLPHFIRETVIALMGRGGMQLVDGQWTLQPSGVSGIARHNLRQPHEGRTFCCDALQSGRISGPYSRA